MENGVGFFLFIWQPVLQTTTTTTTCEQFKGNPDQHPISDICPITGELHTLYVTYYVHAWQMKGKAKAEKGEITNPLD